MTNDRPKPGYKQTEVGVIPEDWDVASLANLTQAKRPISYGIVQTGRQVPGGVFCIRVVDIVNLIKGRFPAPWGVRSAKKWLFHTPSACGGVVD